MDTPTLAPIDPDDFLGTDTEKITGALQVAHHTGRPIFVNREYSIGAEPVRCARQLLAYGRNARCDLKAGHTGAHVVNVGTAHLHVWADPE